MPAVRISLLQGAVTLLVVFAGCAGSGDGWVAGELTLAQCDGNSTRNGAFDLNVGFFAGEALQDPNPTVTEQRNRLTVRLQNASTTIEVSDGLMLQFSDTARVAQAFAAGKLLPVTGRNLCATGCPLAEDLVRARLYLYTSCPDNRAELVAVNRDFTEVPSGVAGQTCQVPSGEERADACAALDDATRAALDTLCAGDFNQRAGAELLRSTLGAGGGSCLYLCRMGDVRRGQDPASLASFAADYGQSIAALFSLRIVDGRAIRSASCAHGIGQIQGMFNFEVRRGLSAQTFP